MPAIRKAEPMEPRRRDEEQDAFTILVIARRPNGSTRQSRGFRPVVALPTGLPRRFTPRNDRKRECKVGVSLCFRTVISVTSGHSAFVVTKLPIRLVPRNRLSGWVALTNIRSRHRAMAQRRFATRVVMVALFMVRMESNYFGFFFRARSRSNSCLCMSRNCGNLST